MRKIGRSLLLCALLVACGGRGLDSRSMPPPLEVEGETLVVTANVTEAFDEADLASLSDLRRFSSRLAAELPRTPDVLLLQEIHPQVIPSLRQILHRTFGEPFLDAARTSKPGTWEFEGSAVLAHETAVFLRRQAFKQVGDASFITNRYLRRDAAPGTVQRHKQVALVTAQRKDGSLMSFASLHFVPRSVFADEAKADQYRARWAARVAGELSEHAGDEALLVMGGDFNSSRCLNRMNRDCEEAPFWTKLTSSTFEMSDARYTFGQRVGMRNLRSKAGVDFIFTNGAVAAAGSDWTYGPAERSDPATYYSDHQFHWALLGT